MLRLLRYEHVFLREYRAPTYVDPRLTRNRAVLLLLNWSDTVILWHL